MLTEFVVPESVTELGYGVFIDCEALKSVYLPNSVTEIGDETFWGCSSLTEVRLPAELKCINYGLFADCVKLETVEIPESVTQISESTFDGCSALKTIELPSAVETIGALTFNGCTSLAEITSRNPEPPAIESEDAFENCNPTAIYVPEGSVSAYKGAFVWNNFNIVGADLSGLRSVPVSTSTAAPKCYNLNGVRINSDGLAPGIYIIDGRKVLVK
jgi:hypothetical protein